MRHALAFALLAVLTCATARPAEAQPRFGTIEERQSNAPGYFFYALPGEGTIRVSVWGGVRSPGSYVVGVGADMEEVMSLAGGPLLAPREERQDRTTTVRLYRLEEEVRVLAYEGTIGDLIREPGGYPPLQDDDIVEVEVVEKTRWTFRDTVTVIGAAATATLAVERLLSLSGVFRD